MARPRPPLALFLLAFLAFVSLGLPDGLLGIAWPKVHRSFDVGMGQIAWMLVTSMAGYLASSAMSGVLMARIGLGKLLVASSALILLSLIVYATTPLWWMMIGVSVFSGLGAGAIDAGINTYAAERFSPRVINWVHACYMLGATTGPALMTWVIATNHSWRLGYAIVGVIIAVLTVAFAATIRLWESDRSRLADPPAQDGASGTTRPAAAPISMHAVLRLPAVWLGIATFFTYAGLEVGTGQWSFSILTEHRALDALVAGTAVSAFWASLGIGRVLFGFASARVRSTTLLRIVILLSPILAAIFWLSPHPLIAAAALPMLGFTLAPIYPLLIAVTERYVGPAATRYAVGLQVASAGTGACVIPAIGWAVAQRQGIETLSAGPMAIGVALMGLYAMSMRRTVDGTNENRRV